MVILDWAAKDGRNIGYKCGSDRIGTFMSLPYLWSAAFAQLHKDISLQTSMLVEHDISQKWKHKVWSAVSINKSSCTSEIFVSFLLLTEWKFHANIQCGHPRAEMTFAVNNAMIWYHSKNGWPILEPGQLFLSIWPKWCISDRDKKVSLLREGLDWDEGLRNGIYEVEDMSTCPRTFRRMSKHPKIPGCLDVSPLWKFVYFRKYTPCTPQSDRWGGAVWALCPHPQYVILKNCPWRLVVGWWWHHYSATHNPSMPPPSLPRPPSTHTVPGTTVVCVWHNQCNDL